MNLFGIWELKKMAMRNLARHKVKTLLTSAAIMISVAVFIFLNSWLGGMAVESRRNIVSYEIGAAKLQTKLYFEKKDEMPSYENFKNWEIYQKALKNEGYMSAPRYTFSGTLFSTLGSAPIMFYAVDPASEKEVLRYAYDKERDKSYVDFGRYVQDGNFEIALGTVAAEKLKVGIPTRPYRRDLEELIASTAKNQEEAEFIRSLYEKAPASKDPFAQPDARATDVNERLIFKKNNSRKDIDLFWDMIAATGRNDVRINAVIDIKAAPEMIRSDKWEVELWPALRAEDRELVKSAYQYEDFMNAYLLAETDEEQLEKVLDAMIRADFSGAINHINQAFDVVVVGVINCPAPLPNGNTAFIPLDILQDEAGMMLDGAVTELVIRREGAVYSKLPGKRESSAAITASLRRGLSEMGEPFPQNLAVRTWQEYMKEYLSYEAVEIGAVQLLAALLFLLSFLGISNTILLAVLERTREIGMMRALGMTDKQMFITYMLEAGFLGFIGSVLGIILGCIVNYPMVKTGIDFSSFGEMMSDGVGFRTTAIFRSMWNIPLIIGSGIVATLLSSCMAFFPTIKAVRMPITNSLRFD